MNGKSRFLKTVSSLAFVGAIAMIVGALATEPTVAKRPPGPLCGPTILMECTFRDGSTTQVGLTVCEVKKFEKKNRATCEPATF